MIFIRIATPNKNSRTKVIGVDLQLTALAKAVLSDGFILHLPHRSLGKGLIWRNFDNSDNHTKVAALEVKRTNIMRMLL